MKVAKSEMKLRLVFFKSLDRNCEAYSMSLVFAWGCGQRPNRSGIVHSAERIADFLLRSDFVKPAIIARSEFIAYAAAVSGLEVVGEAT